MTQRFEAEMYRENGLDLKGSLDRSMIFDNQTASLNLTDKTADKTLTEANILPAVKLFDSTGVEHQNAGSVNKNQEGLKKKDTDGKEASKKDSCAKRNKYGRNYNIDSIITPEEACRIKNWIKRQF